MPHPYSRLLALLLAAVLVLGLPGAASAARGVPGSADFGIGAAVHLDGPFFDQALEKASDLELDWIAVPLSWSAIQPDQGQPLQLDRLDQVMRLAESREIAVMVSLTGAPAWAQTPTGPNAEWTADLVLMLAKRYPRALRAVELFPGANTVEGWGAPADPRSYAALLKAATDALQGEKAPLLAAGGLRLLPPSPSKGDMDDLQFLYGLYAEGAEEYMPVVSLQLDTLTGAPIDFPESKDQRVLRHYEEVRRAMSVNNHQNGRIWITRLSPPSGTIEVSDSVYQSSNMQSNWLSLALIQLRSQLYIGMAVVQSLNPESGRESADVQSLINAQGQVHPFYSVLREMISLNRTGSVTIMPGKPKEGSLGKKRP